MKQIDVSVCIFVWLGHTLAKPSFLSGKVPRSFHKFVSVPKMTGRVFQAISRGFFFLKKSFFTGTMAPKGANRPALLRICTGSAGDR